MARTASSPTVFLLQHALNLIESLAKLHGWFVMDMTPSGFREPGGGVIGRAAFLKSRPASRRRPTFRSGSGAVSLPRRIPVARQYTDDRPGRHIEFERIVRDERRNGTSIAARRRSVFRALPVCDAFRVFAAGASDIRGQPQASPFAAPYGDWPDQPICTIDSRSAAQNRGPAVPNARCRPDGHRHVESSSWQTRC